MSSIENPSAGPTNPGGEGSREKKEKKEKKPRAWWEGPMPLTSAEKEIERRWLAREPKRSQAGKDWQEQFHSLKKGRERNAWAEENPNPDPNFEARKDKWEKRIPAPVQQYYKELGEHEEKVREMRSRVEKYDEWLQTVPEIQQLEERLDAWREGGKVGPGPVLEVDDERLEEILATAPEGDGGDGELVRKDREILKKIDTANERRAEKERLQAERSRQTGSNPEKQQKDEKPDDSKEASPDDPAARIKEIRDQLLGPSAAAETAETLPENKEGNIEEPADDQEADIERASRRLEMETETSHMVTEDSMREEQLREARDIVVGVDFDDGFDHERRPQGPENPGRPEAERHDNDDNPIRNVRPEGEPMNPRDILDDEEREAIWAGARETAANMAEEEEKRRREENERREAANLIDRNFKNGDRVSVRRSSGEVDGDWKFIGIIEPQGVVYVTKEHERGRSSATIGPVSYWEKYVSFGEFLELNPIGKKKPESSDKTSPKKKRGFWERIGLGGLFLSPEPSVRPEEESEEPAPESSDGSEPETPEPSVPETPADEPPPLPKSPRSKRRRPSKEAQRINAALGGEDRSDEEDREPEAGEEYDAGETEREEEGSLKPEDKEGKDKDKKKEKKIETKRMFKDGEPVVYQHSKSGLIEEGWIKVGDLPGGGIMIRKGKFTEVVNFAELALARDKFERRAFEVMLYDAMSLDEIKDRLLKAGSVADDKGNWVDSEVVFNNLKKGNKKYLPKWLLRQINPTMQIELGLNDRNKKITHLAEATPNPDYSKVTSFKDLVKELGKVNLLVKKDGEVITAKVVVKMLTYGKDGILSKEMIKALAEKEDKTLTKDAMAKMLTGEEGEALPKEVIKIKLDAKEFDELPDYILVAIRRIAESKDTGSSSGGGKGKK